jgi:hypothetical protein
MNRVIMAFLFCLASPIVYAAYKPFKLEKPVSCGPAAQLLEFLEKDYNEKQVWVGVDLSTPAGSYVALLRNPANQHWTIVQYDSHTACILASGIQGTPNPVGEPK